MLSGYLRNIFNIKRHYQNVRMQQGRVLVDADENEQQGIRGQSLGTTKVAIGLLLFSGAVLAASYLLKQRQRKNANKAGLLDDAEHMGHLAGFPIECISNTELWEDLQLDEGAEQQLSEIRTWLQQDAKQQPISSLHQPATRYRLLFYGPSGTGKTITAGLLGKHIGKEVYKVDLSQIVSKYIGETEKNLERLFARAEEKDWILYFDEAEALFGKRSDVKDAHDRYANQEVAYLLQRMEQHSGLVIISVHSKDSFCAQYPQLCQRAVSFRLV